MNFQFNVSQRFLYFFILHNYVPKLILVKKVDLQYKGLKANRNNRYEATYLIWLNVIMPGHGEKLRMKAILGILLFANGLDQGSQTTRSAVRITLINGQKNWSIVYPFNNSKCLKMPKLSTICDIFSKLWPAEYFLLKAAARKGFFSSKWGSFMVLSLRSLGSISPKFYA